MKRLFTVLSVALLLSSCAKKSDPGLNDDSVKNTVVDSLKGKSSVEVLKLKYSQATALCELQKVASQPEALTAGQHVPPVTEENELFVDLKKWSETDPELKPANAKVVLREEGTVLTVDVALKVEMVNLSIKRNNLVYFLKHSPQITYDFSAAFEGGGGTAITGTGFINERMNTVMKVGSATVGDGANAQNFDYYLDCSIESKVLKESKNAEEYEAQFEILDCNAPKAAQQKKAADNCKKD